MISIRMPSTGSRAFFSAHRAAIVATVLIVAGGGGYYAYRASKQKNPETTYTLGTVERGTLVSSVSGSGQVSASDQLDVRAKASGQVLFVGVFQGKAVKAGDALVRLDDADARKSVRDAQNSYASAKLSLDKLLTPADDLSVVQAENSLNQAKRSETQSEQNLVQLQASTAQTIATANEDGYNASSQAFLDMPNHMKDLKDLRGSDADPDHNVTAFKHILGENSPLIAIWLRDHDAALASFNASFTFFKTVPRGADDATRYQLMSRTLDTENAVSQALQSAHAMLDAVVNTTYKGFDVASTVDSMRPKISSDISQINGDISKMQSSKDTVDTNTLDLPAQIKKAMDDINAAKESVSERTESLAKLKAGASAIDIQSQKLSLKQRQDALADAQDTLKNYVITAPFDGTVATFALKRGDQVSSGASVATLVTPMRFAVVTLNEVDAVKTKPGQKVTLTFDAIEGLKISGEVATVDTLGAVSQGVVTYGAHIQFDTQDERVRPGMSVSAAIATDVKTDVLLLPGSAVKSQGNSRYVLQFDPALVAGKKTITTALTPTSAAVETGASNDTSTEITGGLKEGDVVVTKSAAATSAAKAAPTVGGIGIPGLGGGFRGGGGPRGD